MAETSEKWIKSTEKLENGRENFEALFRHYTGKGNVIHCISMSDLLREKLHYKSKRALSFNTFLDRTHNMFNILCNEGEQMDDSTQVHELFRRVQHPLIQDTVKALEVRADLDRIKYSEAYNHPTAAVSKIPEYKFS